MAIKRRSRGTLLALACIAMMGADVTAQDNRVARPPVMTPGSNAVIEAVELSGWSTPDALRMSIQNGTIPEALRKLWTEEARRMQRMATSTTLKAARSGGVLMLALKGGRVLKLFDQGIYGTSMFDGDRFHILVDVPLAANLYAVRVMMNEFGLYWLIPHSTGMMTSLPDQPVLSPNLRRAFGFRDEQMNGRELGVVSIGPDQLASEKVAWEPDNDPGTEYALTWTADSQSITVTEIRQKTRRTSYRLIVKDGAWRRE